MLKITMFAESTIVPSTVTDLEGICLHMQVLAIFVIALAKLLIEVADWHLAHVILVEKFTVVTFLAQVTQPVLAYDSALPSDMAKWAMSSSTACPTDKELAQGSLVLWERYIQETCTHITHINVPLQSQTIPIRDLGTYNLSH